MVLDTWAAEAGAAFRTERYGAIAEVPFRGKCFTLLKPSTYMNLSGNAVRYWLHALALPLDKLMVISDDLNLPFGTIRMRKSGSSGGHNGLQNIVDLLESTEFARIRIGIGNDFVRGGQIDFVLGPLSEEERAAVPDLCHRVIEGVKNFALIGPDLAMNTLNTKPKPPESKLN